MALVGLVRVSTSRQETRRQHDDLDPICVRVFEEKVSGKLRIADRPGLRAALDFMRPGEDMLTVQEADRLGRNLLEGLIVLNDPFRQGVAVKILHGIAAGEHTERSLILDLALAMAEDRRRDIARKTRDGLDAAARRGRKGGRPRVVDDDKRRAILARRAEGQALREISRGVGISLAVVHGEVKVAEGATAAAAPDFTSGGTAVGTAQHRTIVRRRCRSVAPPKRYPDELSVRAVRLYRESDPKPTIRKLAAQLGVHHEALRNWIRQAEADAGQRHDRPTTDMAEENEQLRKRVAELERVNAALRDASAYFASELGQTRR
ncbi:recombinase family protein [Nocardia alba]|uniref:DNA invertase Pin-like site-specific DNA recombinase n=1 Tax=Nocardia alba TaxID=225051 RepID=A0A4V2P9F2_9NOCA|nr:recombinase family protein [Nocardia alba]TCJ89395.1 DNA invertase Pin-like site-specific DNA recombinase [Nocardia alba]